MPNTQCPRCTELTTIEPDGRLWCDHCKGFVGGRRSTSNHERHFGNYAVWAGLNITNLIAVGVRGTYVLLVIVAVVKASIESGLFAIPVGFFVGWLFYPVIQKLFPLDRWQA